MKIQNLYSEVNVINLRSKSHHFLKGAGVISLKSLKITLNPPFLKGDLKGTVLKLMTLIPKSQIEEHE